MTFLPLFLIFSLVVDTAYATRFVIDEVTLLARRSLALRCVIPGSDVLALGASRARVQQCQPLSRPALRPVFRSDIDLASSWRAFSAPTYSVAPGFFVPRALQRHDIHTAADTATASKPLIDLLYDRFPEMKEVNKDREGVLNEVRLRFAHEGKSTALKRLEILPQDTKLIDIAHYVSDNCHKTIEAHALELGLDVVRARELSSVSRVLSELGKEVGKAQQSPYPEDLKRLRARREFQEDFYGAFSSWRGASSLLIETSRDEDASKLEHFFEYFIVPFFNIKLLREKLNAALAV